MQNSRESRRGAGWVRSDCTPGSYLALMDEAQVARDARFAWLNPRPLWESRNDRITRLFRGDPVNDIRRAWMAQLAPADPDLLVRHSESGPASFLLMGDTGEGDGSQWVVVPPLMSQAGGTRFLFICSDVIYPAGGTASYADRFFAPYARYPGPIYAIPGNHDWYDDGEGFMRWFCGAHERPRRAGGAVLQVLRAAHVWRSPRRPRHRALDGVGANHDRPGRRPSQPAPYFAIDVGPLRLVGIDTGISGAIDRDQGDWLLRISQGPRPKLLLTGKPIYVDGERHPGPIEGTALTVDDVVKDPAHHYLGAIGGDIHNYQRYLVPRSDGPRLAYVVSGGGGAFMHQTHCIGNLDRRPELGVPEADFRCYPLRSDSLARYSQLYARKLGRLGRKGFQIDPDEAAAFLSARLGLTPTRPDARGARLGLRARLAARLLVKLPARGRRSLHLPFSEWLDWNDPPLFKSFLRVDVDDGRIDVRCFGVTGCGEQETQPGVEDHLVAEASGGEWTWRVADPATESVAFNPPRVGAPAPATEGV